ncbi:MAG TPA: glycosyltransferase family 4 protein [Lacipirellulaceae bacterium]|nr:glycosyltransferase family 4 protein [Lacipirellulaceae bacterium]
MVRGDSQLLTPRSLVKRWAKALVYPRFLRRFDAYLVVGQRAREYYLAYGADPRRMFDCPHFVDNERFASQADELRPRRAEIRRRWGIPEEAFCAAFCGKFIPKKRPMDLVRAAAQTQTHRADGRPIHLLFVGSGELGDAMRRGCHVVYDAERAAHGSPGADGAAASFVGFLNQSEIAAAYVAADALVLASDGGETWGLVVNEAMACGIPAIVSDRVGCAPDLVTDGETGEVVPVGDVDRLAGVLRRWAGDPALVEQLGAGARARIANYSIGAAVDGAVAAVQCVSRGRKTSDMPQRSEATW